MLQSETCCRSGVVSIEDLEDACGIIDPCGPRIDDPEAFAPDACKPEQTAQEKSDLLEDGSLDKETSSTAFDDTHQDAHPIPDGRIYSTPEGPYPYLPTSTPKDPFGLPVKPPELIN